MGLLTRIVIAIVIGAFAALICLGLGAVLVATDLSITVAIGSFLKAVAGLIGVLVALYVFFTGSPARPLL